MRNDRIIKSGDIEKMLKEEIRQAIIVLYNYDVVTGQYVDKELQKEKMIKEIAGKWEGKYSEETIREAMTNNKAREYTSPLIEELLNEVTPEETERTNREMENMGKKCKTKNIQVILESLDPTGVSTKKNEFTMEVIDNTECMRVERLYLHVGDCLYRIDNNGFIIDRVVPHE